MKHRNAVKFVGASVFVAGSALASLALVACGDGGTSGGGGSGSTTGATGATGATSTGTGMSGGNFVTDGFISTGAWKGYAFTVIDTLMEGSMVTPSCPKGGTCTPPFTGKTLHMTGTVSKDDLYNGFAMLGWSVNQEASTDADAGPSPVNAWAVPAAGGMTITFDNPMAVQTLRIQLQEPNVPDGDAGKDKRYCIEVMSGQAIKWADFKSQCWGTMGVPLLPGTMIENAALQIPGSNTIDQPFDITITDITLQDN